MQADLVAVIPPRGAFTFPAPYNTTGIRLTSAEDCGGRDCVKAVGYSYWSNINNHAGQRHDADLPGDGPTLRRRRSLAVQREQADPRDPEPRPAASRPTAPIPGAAAKAGTSATPGPYSLYMNYGPTVHALRRPGADASRRSSTSRSPSAPTVTSGSCIPAPTTASIPARFVTRRHTRCSAASPIGEDQRSGTSRRASANSTSARSTRAGAGW